MQTKPPNLQWRVVRIWTVFTFLFLLGCFTPGFFNIDGMDGGFAIITICGFLVICGLVVIGVYRYRARQLDNMLMSDQNLAWWEIEKPLWNDFISLDFAKDKAISKGTFLLISIISGVIGVVLSLIFKDIMMLYICLGIIVFLIIPAFTFPYFRKRKKLRSPALVIVSENSVYVGGTYFNWDILGARLKHVQLNTSEHPAILLFNMSYPARTGIENYEIRVPVPANKLQEAYALQAHFGF
ncbi:MAG: hypothetical protein M9948_11695 [Lentimicrobium sp.]|nr:hypothetical protein [Lentimicrobium sp.]